ncbi:unnamed protein product [Boreogadus saida]
MPRLLPGTLLFEGVSGVVEEVPGVEEHEGQEQGHSILLKKRTHRLTYSPGREEEGEVLLSPEVTYGPPGLDLSCPVALSVAHCADLSGPTDATLAVRLKRRTPENKWENVVRCGSDWAVDPQNPAAQLRECNPFLLHVSSSGLPFPSMSRFKMDFRESKKSPNPKEP